jgi:hypothetical protein
MRKEKSISTDKWCENYEEEFIQKHEEEETNLDLFHFTTNKLDILRIRILFNCGLSSFNKSHTKIIDKINKEFEDFVSERLSKMLNIKKSGGNNDAP